MSRKTKEPPVKQGLDIFNPKELVEGAINGEIKGVYTETASNIGWRNREYTPVYSFNPLYNFRNNTDDIKADFRDYGGETIYFARNYGTFPRAIIKKLQEKGLYNHLAVLQRHIGDNIAFADKRTNVDRIDRAFDSIQSNIMSTYQYVQVTSDHTTRKSGSKHIITGLKTGSMELAKMKSKVHQKGDDLYNPTYFAGFYFLYMRNEMDAYDTELRYNNNIGRATEVSHDFVPLMVMVTSVVHAKNVGMASALGAKIDPTLVELWVDPSLESMDTAHPIRTQYVRSIRNPLVKAGVKLVVKDLSKEFVTMAPPTFKTIKAEKDWITTRTEELLASYANQWYIKRPSAQVPKFAQKATATAGGLEVEQFPF